MDTYRPTNTLLSKLSQTITHTQHTHTQEGNYGVHENLPSYQLDEITRNAQMILQMLSFGAYREVLAMVSQYLDTTVIIFSYIIFLKEF